MPASLRVTVVVISLMAGMGCSDASRDIEDQRATGSPINREESSAKGCGCCEAAPTTKPVTATSEEFIGKPTPVDSRADPGDAGAPADRGEIVPGTDGRPATKAWEVPRRDIPRRDTNPVPSDRPLSPDAPASDDRGSIETPGPLDSDADSALSPSADQFCGHENAPLPVEGAVGGGGDAATSGSGTDTDRDIALSLRAKLMADESLSLSAKYVAIDSHQGVVVLRGNVLTEHERAEIQRTARTVNGVQDVDDQLRVIRH